MEAEHDYDTGYQHLINQAYYQALCRFQAAAEKGHMMAQLWLEQLYFQGLNQTHFLSSK